MQRTRWRLSLAAALATFSTLAVFEADAQSYPAKPIRIVVGFAAGSGTDITARMLGQKLTEDLGQQVIIENRTGAGGAIAAARRPALPKPRSRSSTQPS